MGWDDWSEKAAKRHEESCVEQKVARSIMERGPYVSHGLLVIPSIWWRPDAVAEWKTRGFRYDGHGAWVRPIPADRVKEQLAKARARYDAIWHYRRDDDGNVIPPRHMRCTVCSAYGDEGWWSEGHPSTHRYEKPELVEMQDDDVWDLHDLRWTKRGETLVERAARKLNTKIILP